VLHLLMCVYRVLPSMVSADEVEFEETLVIRCRRSSRDRVGLSDPQGERQLMLVPDRGYGNLDFQVNLNHELSSGQQKKDKHGT